MMYDTKQQTRPFASEAVREIALDTLNASDCILIKTANSTYFFLVGDPTKRRGTLTGGVLGGHTVATILLGAQVGKSGRALSLHSKLCEGSQAIFFVAAGDRVQQLITSTIIKLIHSKVKTTHHSESLACGGSVDSPTPNQLDSRDPE